MDTLGKADRYLLYNRERKKIIEDDQERDRKTARIMRDGIAHAPDLMDEATVRKFEEICENCMYKALKKLEIKYFGKDEDCHTFIGINPCIKGDKSPQLKNIWNKIIDNLGRYVAVPKEGIAFCVERNTIEGIRPHAHLFIAGKHTQRPAVIADAIAKWFGVKSSFIHVDKFKGRSSFERNLNYIKGIKTDKKDSFMAADKKDRIAEGVPDYYLNL